MIKITPEGIHYVAKTLIIYDYVDLETLKFYDYEKVIFLNYDSMDIEKIKLLKDASIQVFKGIEIYKNEKKSSDVVKIASLKDTSIEDSIKFANVIYDLELSEKPDSLRYRSSNFNQVFAKQFVEKNIILGIQMENLLLNDKILGRIKQNLIIARQYKVPVLVSVFNGKRIFGWYEAMQFLRSLF
ncbi:MAG: hypothetical protein QXR30_04250 [Candidatus Woesearchaeota archaeon]